MSAVANEVCMKIPAEMCPSHCAFSSSHIITSAVTSSPLMSSPSPVVMSDIFHSGIFNFSIIE
jgi:hypothetical protein